MVNTPNYQGMFLRGYDNQNHTQNNETKIGNTITNHISGGIGIIQRDGTRNFTGWIANKGDVNDGTLALLLNIGYDFTNPLPYLRRKASSLSASPPLGDRERMERFASL